MQQERKLTVKIPAGIATGQRLRLSGEGEAGAGGGPAGDLYVVVHVQEHAFFQRDGNDLYCEIPLNFPTLALGGEITIPTLDGEEPFKVPEGTQTGDDVPPARQGHARRRRRPRPRRPARHGEGRHAEEADEGAAEAARAARGDAAEGEVRADAASKSTTTSGIFDRVKDIFG